MNKIEKIKYAQEYIKMLANGIDPTTKKPAPSEDIINNVHLSRCFHFVSEILCEVVESGGTKVKNTNKRTKPFSISREQLQRFEYSLKPLAISEIANRINDLIDDEDMKKLKYSFITRWLIKKELLEEFITVNGTKKKRPTEIGKQAGLLRETREGPYGAYQVVLYNEQAQKLIIDNLDEILMGKEDNTKEVEEPWNAEHEECLIELFQKGVPNYEIAITLNRNISEIEQRLKQLGYQ